MKNLKKVKPEFEDVVDEAGRLSVVAMDIPGSEDWFGQINADAVDYAENHSAELVSQIDESTRNMLRQTISSGLKNGLSRDDILDSIKDSHAFSEERAALIADMEIRNANGEGRLSGYKAARDNGIKLKKLWILGPDSCDLCQEAADAGPIDVDDDFPGVETDVDPGHIHCDCATTTEFEEEDSDEDSGDDQEASGDQGGADE